MFRRHLSFATRAPSLPELRRHLSFATRASSLPELRRHLSFATRAPRSPEFHVPPKLRRHPSFKTRDPPFSERHLRQSFVVTFATPASPSSELHVSPELHLRLPRLLHSMYFYFKPLPTSTFYFLATTTGPGVVATIYPDNLGIVSPTSAAMHRWACRFKPLPAARLPLPGHYHQLRRHRTVSADQLGHASPAPAATAPVRLLLQSATNRPGVAAIVGNYGPSLPSIPATTPSPLLRKMLTLTPQTPQASSLAHFKGLLQRQRLHLHVRCGTRTIHRRVRCPPPSTYHIELLQPCLLPSQSPYRIVREQPVLTGSCSELFNAFYWTIIRLQRS